MRNPYEIGRDSKILEEEKPESSPSNPYGNPGFMVSSCPVPSFVTRKKAGRTFTIGITPNIRETRPVTEGQRRTARPESEGETRTERRAELAPRRLPPTFQPARIQKNPQVGLGLAPALGKKKADRHGKKQVHFRLDSTNHVIRRVPKEEVAGGTEELDAVCVSPQAKKNPWAARQVNVARLSGNNPWAAITDQARATPKGLICITTPMRQERESAEELNTGGEPSRALPTMNIQVQVVGDDLERTGPTRQNPDWDTLNIALMDNHDQRLTLNTFGGFKAHICDSGALPCLMTQRALDRMPEENRPTLHHVVAPLQTVSGHIENPKWETDPVEVKITDPATGHVVKRFVKFLILNKGGYEILLGLSYLKRVGALIDLRREQVTVYQTHRDEVGVTMTLNLWSRFNSVNTVQPVYALPGEEEHHPVDWEDTAPQWQEEELEDMTVALEHNITLQGVPSRLLEPISPDQYESQVKTRTARHAQVQRLLADVWTQVTVPPETPNREGQVDIASVFWKPSGEGYNVLSLFSGIGSDLEALLRSGYQIANYWAVEIQPSARRVAESRYQQLLLQYSGQLNQDSVSQVHTRLPQDVELVSEADLRELGGVDLLIAGWPCQGHSRAGSGEGFLDPRSRLFVELVRVMEILQQNQARPMGYVVENVFSGYDQRSKVILAWKLINQTLGDCVVLDAAQFGSYAHRSRAYWTNLILVTLVRKAVELWPRDATQYVDDILDPGRASAPVTNG